MHSQSDTSSTERMTNRQAASPQVELTHINSTNLNNLTMNSMKYVKYFCNVLDDWNIWS